MAPARAPGAKHAPDTPEGYAFREVHGPEEIEAVASFRYEHYYGLAGNGFPGVDHARRRVFEPHDEGATHLAAFDPSGNLAAVSTFTPAASAFVPAAWRDWFALDGFGAAGRKRLVLSTRLALRPDLRKSGLFAAFYRFIMATYVRSGASLAAHYCRPDLVARYELLGHRRYAACFNLPGGQLRVPMLMVLSDSAYLKRAGSPIADVSAEFFPDGPDAQDQEVFAAFPGLSSWPVLGFIPARERAGLVSRICREAGATEGFSLPDGAGDVLGLAAHLVAGQGQSLFASPREAFVALVLRGEFSERFEDGEHILGPGDFLGLSRFAAPHAGSVHCRCEQDGELAVFASHLVKRAALPGATQAGPGAAWQALGRAARAIVTGPHLAPPLPSHVENGSCGTPSSTASKAS